MVIASVVLSYFLLENMMLTFQYGVYNSGNKLYMSLIMGFSMGVIMILIMFALGHFSIPLLILLGVFIILTVLLILFMRGQVFISDEGFLKAMIEHHDMAILMALQTQRRSTDPDIISLTNSIITDQQEEIQLMKSML